MASWFVMPPVPPVGIGGFGGWTLIPIVKSKILLTQSLAFILAYYAHRLSSFGHRPPLRPPSLGLILCKGVDIVRTLFYNCYMMRMRNSFTWCMRHRYYMHKARCKVMIDENTIIECKPQIGFTPLYSLSKLSMFEVFHTDLKNSAVADGEHYLIVRYSKVWTTVLSNQISTNYNVNQLHLFATRNITFISNTIILTGP